ncbi:MAG: type II toxin-antitoxin system RelE/ParE family toxin [Deltaproteobacteria bacterium]|nr:type II toxin-antitoxin system RelE/ParE family toxin [Deltaproteobacteria bacterium]
MIRSFRCKKTEKIFRRMFTKKIPNNIHRSALRKLRILNRAESLQDLRVPPGNRLETLHRQREGQHSIRINDQWRICFIWREDDAHEVEIVDYH